MFGKLLACVWALTAASRSVSWQLAQFANTMFVLLATRRRNFDREPFSGYKAPIKLSQRERRKRRRRVRGSNVGAGYIW